MDYGLRTTDQRLPRERVRHQCERFAAAEQPSGSRERSERLRIGAADEHPPYVQLRTAAQRSGNRFIEAPPRPVRHEFHLVTGSDAGALLRETDGHVESAKCVHQPALTRLRPGPYAAAAEGIDLLRRGMP